MFGFCFFEGGSGTFVSSLKTLSSTHTQTTKKPKQTNSRAKRLKKLHRLLTCRAAQSATARFKTHTWGLVGIILAAHICCFVVLVLQINSRYKCVRRAALAILSALCVALWFPHAAPPPPPPRVITFPPTPT